MRRAFALLLSLCLALGLCGCAKQTAWSFVLDTRRSVDDYTARSGALLSWYSYELPELALVSADTAPGEQPPEALAAVRDAFNGEMENYRALLLEEYAELEQLAISEYVESDLAAPLDQHAELREVYQTLRLLSVRIGGYTDRGGAYPWGFTRCWAFDLETGAFVHWYDLAKDADALRAALAAACVRQARERGMDAGFYDGWEDTVRAFEGCEAYLGADALTVVFGEQLLGPHAAGLPEFAISYDELSQYLSAYGKQLLKKEG